MSKGNGKKDPILQVVEELRGLRSELSAKIDGVNSRLDRLLENTGEHWRDHEMRIRALERKAGGED